MKKLAFLLIIAVFIFGCKSDEDDTDNTPTDTVVIEDQINPETDTAEVTFSEEEAEIKTDEILQKSEEINKKLDEIISEE